MAQVKSMVALPHKRSNERSRGREMGRGIRRGAARAGHLFGNEVARGRGALCHVLAMTAGLVVFCGILTLWDRTTPFNYLDVSASVAAGYPGDEVELRFLTGPVRSIAEGEFSRIYFDGKARPIFMGTFKTEYNRSAKLGEPGVFYKTFTIPRNAKPGPSVYVVADPKFWHNWVQGVVWPIPAPEQKVRILTLARPGTDEAESGPR